MDPSDPDTISFLEGTNLFPHSGDVTDDFMAGHTGSRGGGVRPSISSNSVWQTPQAETFTRISSGCGSGIAKSANAKGVWT